MPKKKIVFTNGCFEILHPGHIYLLNRASTHGKLIVGVNSDESFKYNKNREPIRNIRERCDMLLSLKSVTDVLVFNEPTPYELIKYLKPDVLIKGGDWENNVVGSDIVKEVYTIPRFGDYSTTNEIKKILEANIIT